MNRQKIVIIGLAVALFLFAQYYVIEKWSGATQQEITATYQNGYNTGAIDTAKAIYQATQDCQGATITVGNITKQVFDASCLKSLEKSPP